MPDQNAADASGSYPQQRLDTEREGESMADALHGLLEDVRRETGHIPDNSVPTPPAGTAVQKWADVAMWQAPGHVDPQRPKVTITSCVRDPLGVMAMVNGQYTGKVYASPDAVTDTERGDAWHAATVSQLSKAPLEWIQVGVLFENVSRAFTHQLVRTRMAGYAQESMRFAVKDNLADSVKLPPSLAGTMSLEEWEENEQPKLLVYSDPTPEQRWRNRWDVALAAVADAYEKNVNDGMPAEDARGLLPTNILTRIHMHVDMGTLLSMAGSRLCTQAQFEWRAVFAELAQALRRHGQVIDSWNKWQYLLMANAFRPVCFAAGKCVMKADADRHCSIRAQVDAFAEAGTPSSEWENPDYSGPQPIRPEQWLADPTAARVAP